MGGGGAPGSRSEQDTRILGYEQRTDVIIKLLKESKRAVTRDERAPSCGGRWWCLLVRADGALDKNDAKKRRLEKLPEFSDLLLGLDSSKS